MNTYKASNVSLADFRKFLRLMGAKPILTRGGHEVWSHHDLPRRIPIQTLVDPVPQFIVLEILNYFDVSIGEMMEMLGKSKGSAERNSGKTKRGKKSGKNKK